METMTLLNLSAEQQQQHQQLDDDQLCAVRVRLAEVSDVPFINRLSHKMAEFHEYDDCQVTEDSLTFALFNPARPPFQSFTVFLLEVITSIPNSELHSDHLFNPIIKTVHLPQPINEFDTEADLFCTEEGATIIGYVFFFPNYSTFLAKPGFHVEDFFVRECYRSKGLGKLLMKAVANQAVRLGYGRMEWTVADSNVDAIRFYERMNAEVVDHWQMFRLTGDSLLSYAQLSLN